MCASEQREYGFVCPLAGFQGNACSAGVDESDEDGSTGDATCFANAVEGDSAFLMGFAGEDVAEWAEFWDAEVDPGEIAREG